MMPSDEQMELYRLREAVKAGVDAMCAATFVKGVDKRTLNDAIDLGRAALKLEFKGATMTSSAFPPSRTELPAALARIEEQDAEIVELREHTQTLSKIIDAKYVRLDAKDAEITRLQALVPQPGEIEALRKLAALESQKRAAEMEAREWRATAESLRRTITKLEAIIGSSPNA